VAEPFPNLPVSWVRLLAGELYGVTPLDPWTFVGTALVVGVGAAIAGLLPLRRALNIDPASALRCE